MTYRHLRVLSRLRSWVTAVSVPVFRHLNGPLQPRRSNIEHKERENLPFIAGKPLADCAM